MQNIRRAARRRADCFYVYPTVTDQQRPQATQVVDDVLRSIALYQAARYSRDCRVFAPVYRQLTIQGLLEPDTVTPEMREQALRRRRRGVAHLPARASTSGRGVVLMGHSQGTFVLRRLIREEIDPQAGDAQAARVGGAARRQRPGDEGRATAAATSRTCARAARPGSSAA